MTMLPASTTSFQKIGNSSVCNLRTYPNRISSCIFLCIVQNIHVPKCVSPVDDATLRFCGIPKLEGWVIFFDSWVAYFWG